MYEQIPQMPGPVFPPAPKGRKYQWRLFLMPLRVIPKFLGYLLLFVVVIGLILLLSVVPSWDKLQSVYRQSINGKYHLEAAQNYLLEEQFSEAATELTLARQNFTQAEEDVQELEQKTIFKLPVVKGQIEIADEVITIGRSLSTSLEKVAVFATDIMKISESSDLNFEQLSEAQKKEILRRLSELGPELEKSKSEIKNIEVSWNTLSLRRNTLLWQPILSPLKEKLPAVLENFDTLILASNNLPSLVGYPSQKTYLFLLQNNNELRPGGGFIGTYGILKLRNAEILSFETDNVYNLDGRGVGRMKIEPPAPMKKYLVPYWFMRDANWWPDFPTSARKVEEFYQLEMNPGENLDGVLAINPQIVEDLLELVGPITVEGVTFNKDNFTQELQYQVEFGYGKKGIPTSERKDIIGTMSKTLEKKVFSLPLNQWPQLIGIIKKNLDEKYALAYLHDAEAQAELEKRSWAGAVNLTEEDYLMVVDANLAAYKTDAKMKKSLVYKLTSQDNSFQAQTSITYQHNGNFDVYTTRYRSYTRLYVPAGSKLQSVSVGGKSIDLKQVDVYAEFNKTVFGIFFQVEPQTTSTLIFKYQLPASITEKLSDGSYKLVAQKQPGMRTLDMTFDLTFPKKIQSFSGQASTKNLTYKAPLSKDEEFEVLFE